MSFEALRWAAEVQCPDAPSKLVLLVLASFMNQKHGRLDPGLTHIARRAQLSRRAVIQKLALLEDAGLIKRIVRNVGPDSDQNTTNFYVLQLGVVNDIHHGGEPDALRVVNDVHPNKEPRTKPLPPGWAPPLALKEELAALYPELDLDASTARFTSHYTAGDVRRTDDGWVQRWRAWITEDGSRPGRSKRTAARATRTERLSDLIDRRTNDALALIREVQEPMAGGVVPLRRRHAP